MSIPSHPRCDQIVEQASDYLEHALASSDAESLEQHLVICSACSEYIAQMRAVAEAAAKLRDPADEPPDAAHIERVLGAFRRERPEGGT